MDTLRAILVTAEPLEVDVWKWTYKVVGTGYTPVVDSNPRELTGRIPVVNMYVQSEIGTFVTGNLANYTFPPIVPGSCGPSNDLRLQAPLVIVKGSVDPNLVRKSIRERLGPIAEPRNIIVLNAMPETQLNEMWRTYCKPA